MLTSFTSTEENGKKSTATLIYKTKPTHLVGFKNIFILFTVIFESARRKEKQKLEKETN